MGREGGVRTARLKSKKYATCTTVTVTGVNFWCRRRQSSPQPNTGHHHSRYNAVKRATCGPRGVHTRCVLHPVSPSPACPPSPLLPACAPRATGLGRARRPRPRRPRRAPRPVTTQTDDEYDRRLVAQRLSAFCCFRCAASATPVITQRHLSEGTPPPFALRAPLCRARAAPADDTSYICYSQLRLGVGCGHKFYHQDR